jgi:trehalose synthase
MPPETVQAILEAAGIVEPMAGAACGQRQPARHFTRDGGDPGMVTRRATVIRSGHAPRRDEPLVVQVSRWDPLKDHPRVMAGFAHWIIARADIPAHLLLVGPDNGSVADDPESVATFTELVRAWEDLPAAARARVHIVSLPMDDLDENAAMVNAIQRHAAVVVQKSLKEGFGLTVTEAMWKSRPVVASRVGGIQDQLQHDVTGLMLDDPADLDAYIAGLDRLFSDPLLAASLGSAARMRVRERGLIIRDLVEVLSVASGAPRVKSLRDAA